MEYLLNKKIGVWGYGLTGKAAVKYLSTHPLNLLVLDKNPLSLAEQDFLRSQKIEYVAQEKLTEFLENSDYIFPSPGIDLRPYSAYKSKWLNELDLFSAEWHTKCIAITGSIGKTTITHLLSLLLAKTGKSIALGGNIGTPLFDLLALEGHSDAALVELSSFQLEHTKKFAPTLAVWTNFYPNHLDRHGSAQEYKKAKAKLMAFQTSADQALIPLELKDDVKTNACVHYFIVQKPSIDQLDSLSPESQIYYFEGDALIKYKNGVGTSILQRAKLPSISYEENWLIISAILDLLNLPMPEVEANDFWLPEHRLELVNTINGITFYNDSKSTTPQSTLAAVQRLSKQPILLLLGGISKGVDRSSLIAQLKGKVKKIYCFGKEASHLKQLCDAQQIASEAHSNLDTAFAACVRDSKPLDQIMLSPAGASYDLFLDYRERGSYFKKLVTDLTHHQ